MSSPILLPSIRSSVGDWNYYVTTLTLEEVAAAVGAPDEIHERKRLSDWIQREAIDSHSKAIAVYLAETPQRFLGSLIVGVYGGAPNWTPLNIRVPTGEDLAAGQLERVEGRLGLLHLTGSEKLFAIDGQHRVAGIKLALADENLAAELADESVSAVFVAHDPDSAAGRERTRRLFTTVNKKAKLISKAARIALDEDDGFAIVTRRLIDDYWLFDDNRRYLLYSSGGAIPASDNESISSVVGLFEIVRDLYGKPGDFDTNRPTEDELALHFDRCVEFLDQLLNQIPEYKNVFVKQNRNSGDYRKPDNNHMLFRPVGQRVFARAVELLTSRGLSISAAVRKLRVAEMYIQKPEWHHIMWNPISHAMITNRFVIAEAQLLRLSGQELRNRASGRKLDELLSSVDSRDGR